MKRTGLIKTSLFVLALIPLSVAVTPATSSAAVFVSAGISISAGVPPPALPVYAQPPCPTPGYLWTPGYWGYRAGSGYYWIQGAWVRPPGVGVLWTPPYWGFAGGVYGFHAGYWGPHVGFYGGVNYGFGYTGVGFSGGYWHGSTFAYNRAVTNVNVNVIHNTYVRNVSVVRGTYAHTSYNGGPNGIRATATAAQISARSEAHYGPTSSQQQLVSQAQANRAQYASVNHGQPAALATNRSGFGYRNEVNTRQGNQQSRISHGVNTGQITPGEERNLESRDRSINSQANAERAQNGGSLTPGERAQINARQNHASRAIYNDRHNANTDAAAAQRKGSTAAQQHHAARQGEREGRPRG